MASGATHTPSPRRSRRVDGVRAVPYSTEGQRASQRRPLDVSRRRRRRKGRRARTILPVNWDPHRSLSLPIMRRSASSTHCVDSKPPRAGSVDSTRDLCRSSTRTTAPSSRGTPRRLRPELLASDLRIRSQNELIIQHWYFRRPVRKFDEGLLERFLKERVPSNCSDTTARYLSWASNSLTKAGSWFESLAPSLICLPPIDDVLPIC